MDCVDITIEDIIASVGEDKLQWLFSKNYSEMDGTWLFFEEGNHKIIKYCENSIMVRLYFYNVDKEHIIKSFIFLIPKKWL